MSFHVEKLPGEPIIFLALNEDYDLMNEIEFSNKALRDLFEAQDDPQILIIDFKVNLKLDEIIAGSSNVGRGEQPIFHHPNIKQIIFVTSSPALRLSAKGLGSDMFGNLNIHVVDTVEDALAHARSS